MILKLWTEDKVDFEGKFYKANGAVLEPKPIQKPYPKLLFGSRGKRMLELSGTFGNIIYLPPFGGYDPEEARQTVIQAAEKANRMDKIGFMTGGMGHGRVTDPDEIMNAIQSAKKQGDKYYLVSLPRDESGIDSIRKFAKEIMPSFK